MELSRLTFPYVESKNTNVSLNKAIFIAKDGSSRVSVVLDDSKAAYSIQKSNSQDLFEPVSYIDNTLPNSSTPLLIRIPADHSKVKLSVSIKPKDSSDTKSLVLVKSLSSNDNLEDQRKQLVEQFQTKGDQIEPVIRNLDKLNLHNASNPELSSETDQPYEHADLQISKIEYRSLPVERGTNEAQNITINDTFELNPSSNFLNWLVWENDEKTGGYEFLFKFNVWVDSEPQISFTETPSPTKLLPKDTQSTETSENLKVDTKIEEKKNEDKPLKLKYFKEGFSFNIEDGPEFRTTLNKYETNLPNFRKLCSNLLDESKSLEMTLRRLTTSKYKLIEHVNALSDLQFNPILKLLNFPKNFAASLDLILKPFEANLRFFLHEVFDYKLIQKLSQITTSFLHGSSSNSTNNTSSNNNPSSVPNPNELSHLKKQFENSSKEFYSWLYKYLSNDKERSKEKLLQKRKAFELAKFDYINHLNMISNNQYLNQLLENLFKFINLGFDPKNSKELNFKEYRDLKSSQNLLTDEYEIYLNVLLRFNSEKYQLRQMIEVSQTNEELTRLIKYNSLNNPVNLSRTRVNVSVPAGADPAELPYDVDGLKTSEFAAGGPDVSQLDENIVITKENLDLIFSNGIDGLVDNHKDGSSSSPIDQQSSDISGILYTLGGQGKQGWHKEWVVLSKGRLIEYSDWRKGTSPINKPIEIALSNVKALNYEKRKNCFEIMTSLGQKHVFQALNEDERDKWMKALWQAGQVVDTSRLENYQGDTKKKSGKDSESIGRMGSIKPSLRRNGRSLKVATDLQPPVLSQSNDRSISPISLVSKSNFEDQESLFNVVKSIPQSGNTSCVDCGSTEFVEWISINFLVCFCINCSSCHRNLGSHITKIRSLKLDTFDSEIKFLLKYVNNNHANEYLEEKLNTGEFKGVKPTPSSSHEQRLEFIRDKYQNRKYIVRTDDPTTSLLKALQKINIPETLRMIAYGADINAQIQLAANSKRGAQNISVFEYSLRKYIEIHKDSDPSSSTKLFALSELLILNGCKTDNLVLSKDIGLTEEALQYWKHRSAKLGTPAH